MASPRHLSIDDLNKAALDQFVYRPVSRDMIVHLADAAHNVITCDSTPMPATSTSSSTSSSSSSSSSSPSSPPCSSASSAASSSSSSSSSSSPHSSSSTSASSPSTSKSVSTSSSSQGLPPTPPRSPESSSGKSRPVDESLPTVDEFITQLVVSSNVQVPTLMATLVYLTRLKSKLQPMARGLRCTTHRIFLASLILAAKYLNDSSPKNKHWARYTHINSDAYSFGFSRTEVNLMEKQLLFLLEWDLRISEHDLYRELDTFLDPLRVAIVEKQARKMRLREEQRRLQETHAAATPSTCPGNLSCRAVPRSRRGSLEMPPANRGSTTPPGLTYSSSSSSYASSVTSSRQLSCSTTPLASTDSEPAVYEARQASPYHSSPDAELDKTAPVSSKLSVISCDLSAEDQRRFRDGEARKRHRRGMWERLLGGTVAVR